MRRKDKNQLIQIIISSICLLSTVILEKTLGFPFSLTVLGFDVLPLAVYLISYVPVGYTVLFDAARNIVHGQVFNEKFLMSLATVAALLTGEYAEAVFVMLFYQIGELFEHIAVGRSRKSISALLSIRADTAFVEDAEGNIREVDCEEIAVGDVITVKAGGKIPLDGVIVEGRSSLNAVALTGESLPRAAEVGDEALSGCINEGGILKIRVTKPFSESTVSKILALVESSAENKSKNENFITKFARIYTPAVVVCATLLGVLPPLVLGINDASVWREWIMRAMTFLVISCPCALVISVPLSYFGGIGAASKKGILIKGSNYLDALSLCDTVVFDKTGTLTRGTFSVTEVICSDNNDRERLLSLVSAAEKYSTHPLAVAICKYCENEKITPACDVTDIEELSGFGIKAMHKGETLLLGNGRLMDENNVVTDINVSGQAVHIALGGKYLGCVLVSDVLRDNAAVAINKIRSCGISSTVMLSGDKASEASRIAGALSLDSYRAELMPCDKVFALEEIMQSTKGLCAYVGDGINDAPVLARADVGIAMGALGSDAAIEAADIVLMNDNIEKINDAILLSKRTRRIVLENIIFALAVKAVALILGALGIVGLAVAVFADVGVTVIAILNSMRNLK